MKNYLESETYRECSLTSFLGEYTNAFAFWLVGRMFCIPGHNYYNELKFDQGEMPWYWNELL